MHGTETVDFAVNVVIAIDQTDILDLGADLDHTARPLEFKVFDQRDCERISVPMARKCQKGLQVKTCKPFKSGAAGRIRTHDPLVRSQVL